MKHKRQDYAYFERRSRYNRGSCQKKSLMKDSLCQSDAEVQMLIFGGRVIIQEIWL